MATDQARADAPLTEAEDKGLLGLSYLAPLAESYLAARLGVSRDTVDALVARGLALRETYRDEGGLEFVMLRLTVAGAKRRQARAQAMDRDPARDTWREAQQAELLRGEES